MALIARDLSCLRGGRTVFRDVSFNLGAGEVLSVTGPNGAGKTSLLRMIAGLLSPAGGSVAWDLIGHDEARSSRLHLVGHRDAIKDALSVEGNLAFWRAFLGGKTPLTEALAALGLARLAPLPAGVLSAGQRRRLALGRLLAAPRPLWLLDEPAASLDTEGRAILTALIQNHCSGGGMAMIAGHGELPLAQAKTLKLGTPA